MKNENILKNLSDVARVNKTAILCHGIIDSVITLAYLVEVIKGSRSIPYFLLIALLAMAPIAVEAVLYRKNSDATAIKHVMAWCYVLLYAVAVFTTNSLLPFTYILPMLAVVTLYSDPGYCLRLSASAFLVNVADVVYKAITVGFASEELPDVEIRLLLTLLVSIFVVLSTRVLKQINENKRQQLEAEKEKIERLLQEVMRLSGELSEGIEQVDEHMSVLDTSTEKMGSAMEEVNAGTMETAESVQNQLLRTEEIQKLIDEVRDASEHIMEGMETASKEVESGLVNMDELARQAGKSKQANETVVKLMDELQKQAEKMTEIITLITSVANRTGMLALNASIEAARAGDAGRGFAVVATQVTDLSEQTKQAAVNITELIHEVVGELAEVTDAVAVLDENTKAQDEKAGELGRSFQTITDTTHNMAEKVQGMEKMITDLAKANGDIVQSIQTISAVTEEVTAHSSETMNACRENQKIVNEVSEIAAKLNQNAQELKNAQEQ
ncbi:MAG: methyl-accepting chemotaxis protein [Lachnospiraceae bacterium]